MVEKLTGALLLALGAWTIFTVVDRPSASPAVISAPASEPPTPEHVASIGDGLSCSGDDASGQSVCDLPALHGEPLLRAPPTFVFIGDEGTERTRVLGERNADDFASTVEAACDVSCEGS